MNLKEITEKVKDGENVTKEDLKMSLLVLDSIVSQMVGDVNDMYVSKNLENRRDIAEKSIGNFKRAQVIDPKEWLGNNHPGNPKYRRMRVIMKEVAKKFLS